ncbi:MAG: hypothetical protein F6K10_29610 [Moorea sp. SIO2B7]|nr:hypothetical protein [Moorena sp. SIO2B7]
MTQSSCSIFRISSIIQITLSSLYLALTIPLPFLAQVSATPVSPGLLWIGIALGSILLHGCYRYFLATKIYHWRCIIAG